MDFGTKCIIGMVGLPNRGKTYFSRKLARYLCWIGYDSQVFNVTQYRAELMTKSTVAGGSTEEFFDYSKFNTEAAHEAMKDVAEYINDTGEIAIYDGLNITHMEREQFKTELEKLINWPYNLVWVESWCDDKDVLVSNFKTTRENYEEYQNMTDDEVYEAFESKIQNLKDQYETLDSSLEKSFVKIVNMGKSVEIVKVNGIKFINIDI